MMIILLVSANILMPCKNETRRTWQFKVGSVLFSLSRLLLLCIWLGIMSQMTAIEVVFLRRLVWKCCCMYETFSLKIKVIVYNQHTMLLNDTQSILQFKERENVKKTKHWWQWHISQVFCATLSSTHPGIFCTEIEHTKEWQPVLWAFRQIHWLFQVVSTQFTYSRRSCSLIVSHGTSTEVSVFSSTVLLFWWSEMTHSL